MNRLLQPLFVILLLLAGNPTEADQSVMLSPSIGFTSSNDIEGKYNSSFMRADYAFFPETEYGFGLFFANHSDFLFLSSTIISGYGIGVTRRWSLLKHFQPYLRADLFSWEIYDNHSKIDSGYSPGFTIGLQLPIWDFFSYKLEASQFFDINGTDIEQFGVGTTFEF